MPLKNLSRYAQAFDEGGHFYSPFFKSSVPNVGAGRWVDLSMGSGTPKFNAYVGGQLEATPMIGSGNFGLYLGPNVPGRERYLHKIEANTNTGSSVPFHLMLVDTLMFYPLIDLDSSDDQIFDNTATLPRYQDAKGVRAMLVVTSPMGFNGFYSYTYTNQDGVQKSVTFRALGTSTVIGGIVSGQKPNNPVTYELFLPLADGDSGIRNVVSFNMNSTTGGFACLVLVYPLAQLTLLELGVPNEVCLPKQMSQMKQVYDGACLNFVGLQQGSSGPTGLSGIVEFINV